MCVRGNYLRLFIYFFKGGASFRVFFQTENFETHEFSLSVRFAAIQSNENSHACPLNNVSRRFVKGSHCRETFAILQSKQRVSLFQRCLTLTYVLLIYIYIQVRAFTLTTISRFSSLKILYGKHIQKNVFYLVNLNILYMHLLSQRATYNLQI